MQQAINGFSVQQLNHKGPKQQIGWQFSEIDLNEGIGGDYIYVGFSRGEDPVTNLNFVSYSRPQENPPEGWLWPGPYDLNKGAGGKYIYLAYQKGGKNPIYNIHFVSTYQSKPPVVPGYTAIQTDLNEGAGGPYIWGYYTTAPGLFPPSVDISI